MERLGIEPQFETSKVRYDSRGNPICCIKINIYYKGDTQYLQYHCYKLIRSGEVIYDEGNQVSGINGGILAYIGDWIKVDNYFETKARQMADKLLKSTRN